jgi:dipeptidyl aminopeptidase/acylaminoacyl peptidase
MKFGARSALFVLSCMSASVPIAAQEAPMTERIEALGRISAAWSPSISSDGKHLVYLSRDSGSPQIWIRDLPLGEPRQLTNLPDPVGSVFWSPNSDLLAYTVAPGGGLNTQIWVMASDGTNARRLTLGGTDNNGLSGWTRDGKYLTANTNKNNPAALDAALIDVESGLWTMVTTNRGLNSISDKRGSNVTVARLIGRGDVNSYLVNLDTGAETLLSGHTGKAETDAEHISPDGSMIYVLSNVDRDRAAFGKVSIDKTGNPSPIQYFAKREDAEAEVGVFSEDGRTSALAWNAGGKLELEFYDTATGKTRPVKALPIDTGGPVAFSSDGQTLMLAGGAANQTTDIYFVDVASTAITRITQSAHDGVDLTLMVRPELIEYQAPDGVNLSGWLYRPSGASGPMPLVFNYHGGPEGQSRPTLDPTTQALVASGIAVFAPNVRGSTGYGKAFMALDDGAKRVGSIADIKASTDALVGMGIADPAKLGIMGGSYGGYMVMAGITEFPSMFAAGVNLFGVVNFESFFRETEPFIAAISTTEYGDPVTEADLLKSLSPIHKLDQITTPLFVLHGANDTNVPVVEAEQIVASLEARGVPVKYTLFPDEGHGWRKTANRVRSTIEIVGFFKSNLMSENISDD